MNTNTLANDPQKSLGAWQMLGLHLLPGALITFFYFLIAPAIIRAGYPPMMAILLAILVILIPFELGFLYYQGKKLNGHYSLKGVVLLREQTPTWQFVLLGFALILWAGLPLAYFRRSITFLSRPCSRGCPIGHFQQICWATQVSIPNPLLR